MAARYIPQGIEVSHMEWAKRSYPPAASISLIDALDKSVVRGQYGTRDTVNFKSKVDWSKVPVDLAVDAHVYLQGLPADLSTSTSGDGWDGTSGRWNEIDRLRAYYSFVAEAADGIYFNSESSRKGKLAGFKDTGSAAYAGARALMIKTAEQGALLALVVAGAGAAAGLTFGGGAAAVTTAAAVPATATVATTASTVAAETVAAGTAAAASGGSGVLATIAAGAGDLASMVATTAVGAKVQQALNPKPNASAVVDARKFPTVAETAPADTSITPLLMVGAAVLAALVF